MRKGKVKGGGVKNGNELASWILLHDSPFRIIIISLDLGSKFVRPIEPINRLIQAHFNVHQKI